MAMYRVFTDADGESHIEEMSLADHPELGSLTNVSAVQVQEFDGSRHRDFHPLPERRLIIHMSGEVEIGASDGSKIVLRGRRHPPDGGCQRKGPYPQRPFTVVRGLRRAD